eukprot:2824057-Rhodomonas_salina.1
MSCGDRGKRVTRGPSKATCGCAPDARDQRRLGRRESLGPDQERLGHREHVSRRARDLADLHDGLCQRRAPYRVVLWSRSRSTRQRHVTQAGTTPEYHEHTRRTTSSTRQYRA